MLLSNFFKIFFGREVLSHGIEFNEPGLQFNRVVQGKAKTLNFSLSVVVGGFSV